MSCGHQMSQAGPALGLSQESSRRPWGGMGPSPLLPPTVVPHHSVSSSLSPWLWLLPSACYPLLT
jgi:hypothetical protein